MISHYPNDLSRLTFWGRTGKRRFSSLRTNLQQLISSRAYSKRQLQSRPRFGHILSNATPDRLDRHPIIGGVQQVNHAGFWIVPQRSWQRFVRANFTQIFRIPMRKSNCASHCSIGVIFYQQFNRLSSVCARNYA